MSNHASEAKGGKKPYNFHWTTTCNTTLRPRLAVAKVFLYNKLYLFDTVLSVIDEEESYAKFCVCMRAHILMNMNVCVFVCNIVSLLLKKRFMLNYHFIMHKMRFYRPS